MAEQIRAEEGAIEKGATAVDNARSGIENRIKDIEAKMAELGSFWSRVVQRADVQLAGEGHVLEQYSH